METLWQDLRFGVRMLKTNPGFTLAAMIALALGIGANTAIFSVVMTVLVRPLPFQEPETLVHLWERNQTLGVNQTYLTFSNVAAIQQQARCFAQMTAWTTWAVNLKNADRPERVEGIQVNTNFFQTLGAQPLLGRAFRPDDITAGDGNRIVISYGLWQRQFGGDPQVIGQTLKVNSDSNAQTIIGVMPAEFQFPPRADLWMPMEDFTPADIGAGGGHEYRVIGRLHRGVTRAQAQAELNVIAQNLARQYPDKNLGWEIPLVAFHDYLFGPARVALPLLLGAVGCVLLIACTNVANLQLARAATRHKEIAVRLALGANRWRITRQLLTESLILAVIGGTLGLLLALWPLDLLRSFGPETILRLKEATINTPVLSFTAALSLLTGMLFGLFPAWQASRPDLTEALKETGGSATSPPSRHTLRQALIISQIAVALVLLVSASLLIKSFWQVRAINPGFAAEHVLTAGISLNLGDYPNGDPRRAVFFQQVVERLRNLPGVVAVGAISHLPLGGRGVNFEFEVKGQPHVTRSMSLTSDGRVITPAYFEAMRIPLRQGRGFTERDTAAAPKVIVVNEAFARAYFPGRSPLGAQLRVGGDDNNDFISGEIIGVVGDVRHRGLETEARPEFYLSHLQNCIWPIMNFVIRTTADPAKLAASVRREVQAIDPYQPVFNLRPMEEFLSESISQRRFNMLLLVAFAVLAMLLAAAGIYGVISYSVAQRTREIGIRIALGAETRDVLRLVLGQGMKLTLIGVAVGLMAAFGLTRLMENLLFGVSATDAMTFALIALLLMSVALLACYLPARRAAKVDPMIALRCK